MWVGVFALGSILVSAVVHHGVFTGVARGTKPPTGESSVTAVLVSSCSLSERSVTMLNPSVNHSNPNGSQNYDLDPENLGERSGVSIQLVDLNNLMYDVIPPKLPNIAGAPNGNARLHMHLGKSENRSDFVESVNNGRTATLTSTIAFNSRVVSSEPFTIRAGQELKDISLLVRELAMNRNEFVVFTVTAEWANLAAPEMQVAAATYGGEQYYCFLVMADPALDVDESPLPTPPRWTLRLDRLGVFVAGGADGGTNPAAQLRGNGSENISRAFIGGAGADSASAGKGFCGTLQSPSNKLFNHGLTWLIFAGALGTLYWRRRLLKRSMSRC